MQPLPGTAAAVTETAYRTWLQATAAGALAVTTFDALLLQQKKSFFTGGFLTAIHTETLSDALTFLILSLCSDAAAVGVIAAAALWLTSRLRLSRRARQLTAVIVGIAPLLVADFVIYRLGTFLGDAFDVSLLFDLTGRNPEEMLAVASGHTPAPLLALGVAGASASALIWVVNRFAGGGRARQHVPPRLAVLAAMLFALGCITTAVATTRSEMLDDGLGRKPSGRVAGSFIERLTDIDRDGFGVNGTAGDPAPFNAAIYPYAVEVPGNSIDENGVGGDLPVGLRPYDERVGFQQWRRRPNVVLIVLESFRADAVGRVIDGKRVTPVLDELAQHGVATTALSHNGYTAQSRFHIFSGSLAGLRSGKTLIDDFKANGYEVAYFSAQDDSFGGDAYAVGFDRADVAYDARQDRRRRYSSFTTAGSLAVPYDVVQERLATFLNRRDNARPLFLYLNFHETHYPYHRPGLRSLVSSDVIPESRIRPSNAAALQAMYYNTAANVDAAIGSTLNLLEDRLGQAPALIVTADHGESLFDEAFLGHGYALNDAQTSIPLLVCGLPMEIAVPFGQADLRDAVGAALARPPGVDAPRVVSDPRKKVFQYLGKIDRPRQIAFSTRGSRTIYDFRTKRVQFEGGRWERTDSLQGAALLEFLELVHMWERMVLARAARTGAPAESGL